MLSPSLVRLWPDWRSPAATAWALYSSRSDKNPTRHAFLDLLKARLRGRASGSSDHDPNL